MRVFPYTSQHEPRRIVFIVEANTGYIELCDEHGGTVRYDQQNGDAALLALKDSAVYSLVKPSQLIWFPDARYWKIIKYHGRVKRLIYRDTLPVYSWSGLGADPQGIMPFFDAMADLGVQPWSLGTMAKHSWRRTLRPKGEWLLEVVPKGREPIGRNAFLGGRKEALNAPANYEGAHYLDLPAAYVTAMANPIPLHIRECKPEWCDDGIAYATVNVPQQPWNPLPRRIATGGRGTDFLVYGYGTTTGYFILSELRNAVDNFGVEAKLERVWRGHLYKPIFAKWIDNVKPLRKLPGTAGAVAKQMSNTLWSQFAANPKYETEIITHLDSRGTQKEYSSQRNADYTAKTVFLSAIIASRVRTRLLNELAQAGAVYLDTDGGIVPRNVSVPGWEQRRIMDRVEIKAPQAFRWRCPDCSESHAPWHYSIAGVPKIPWMQDAFWQHFSHKMMADISPSSASIPAMDFNNAATWLEANK